MSENLGTLRYNSPVRSPQGGTLVLIALVPGHCLPFTFSHSMHRVRCCNNDANINSLKEKGKKNDLKIQNVLHSLIFLAAIHKTCHFQIVIHGSIFYPVIPLKLNSFNDAQAVIKS